MESNLPMVAMPAPMTIKRKPMASAWHACHKHFDVILPRTTCTFHEAPDAGHARRTGPNDIFRCDCHLVTWLPRIFTPRCWPRNSTVQHAAGIAAAHIYISIYPAIPRPFAALYHADARICSPGDAHTHTLSVADCCAKRYAAMLYQFHWPHLKMDCPDTCGAKCKAAIYYNFVATKLTL